MNRLDELMTEFNEQVDAHVSEISAEEVREYLDALIDAADVIRKKSNEKIGPLWLGTNYSDTDGKPEIQIYSGVRWAANKLGMDFTIRDRDDEYHYVMFTYRGYTIFELEEDNEFGCKL